MPPGYQENNRGAAVTPDGKLWLARLGGGLVSWDPATRNYNTIQHWSQVPSDLMDVQADPGRHPVAGDFGRLAAPLRPGLRATCRPGRA